MRLHNGIFWLGHGSPHKIPIRGGDSSDDPGTGAADAGGFDYGGSSGDTSGYGGAQADSSGGEGFSASDFGGEFGSGGGSDSEGFTSDFGYAGSEGSSGFDAFSEGVQAGYTDAASGIFGGGDSLASELASSGASNIGDMFGGAANNQAGGLGSFAAAEQNNGFGSLAGSLSDYAGGLISNPGIEHSGFGFSPSAVGTTGAPPGFGNPTTGISPGQVVAQEFQAQAQQTPTSDIAQQDLFNALKDLDNLGPPPDYNFNMNMQRAPGRFGPFFDATPPADPPGTLDRGTIGGYTTNLSGRFGLDLGRQGLPGTYGILQNPDRVEAFNLDPTQAGKQTISDEITQIAEPHDIQDQGLSGYTQGLGYMQGITDMMTHSPGFGRTSEPAPAHGVDTSARGINSGITENVIGGLAKGLQTLHDAPGKAIDTMSNAYADAQARADARAADNLAASLSEQYSFATPQDSRDADAAYGAYDLAQMDQAIQDSMRGDDMYGITQVSPLEEVAQNARDTATSIGTSIADSASAIASTVSEYANAGLDQAASVAQAAMDWGISTANTITAMTIAAEQAKSAAGRAMGEAVTDVGANAFSTVAGLFDQNQQQAPQPGIEFEEITPDPTISVTQAYDLPTGFEDIEGRQSVSISENPNTGGYTVNTPDGLTVEYSPDEKAAIDSVAARTGVTTQVAAATFSQNYDKGLAFTSRAEIERAAVESARQIAEKATNPMPGPQVSQDHIINPVRTVDVDPKDARVADRQVDTKPGIDAPPVEIVETRPTGNMIGGVARGDLPGFNPHATVTHSLNPEQDFMTMISQIPGGKPTGFAVGSRQAADAIGRTMGKAPGTVDTMNFMDTPMPTTIKESISGTGKSFAEHTVGIAERTGYSQAVVAEVLSTNLAEQFAQNGRSLATVNNALEDTEKALDGAIDLAGGIQSVAPGEPYGQPDPDIPGVDIPEPQPVDPKDQPTITQPDIIPEQPQVTQPDIPAFDWPDGYPPDDQSWANAVLAGLYPGSTMDFELGDVLGLFEGGEPDVDDGGTGSGDEPDEPGGSEDPVDDFLDDYIPNELPDILPPEITWDPFTGGDPTVGDPRQFLVTHPMPWVYNETAGIGG